MTLRHLVLLIFVSSGLLSGCAYIEGRKDQKAAASHPPSTVQKSTTGRVISVPEPVQPSPNTTSNPAATASKILAPIVQ